MFLISDDWRVAFPEAAVGFLVMHDVANPEHHEELDRRKAELETSLRARFAGQQPCELENLPAVRAYQLYYKHFKKTYHVLLQLESVVFKGKSIPGGAALVEAMFMAELQNQLLTAGHDLDALEMPVTVRVGQEGECYTLLRGDEQEVKPADMLMSDGKGIISSVIYGPDQRTRINPATRRVLFAVYAPAGIGEAPVYQHLRGIQENVLLVSPQASIERLEIFT